MVEAIHFIFIHDQRICVCSCFDENVWLGSSSTSCRDREKLSSTSLITLCNSCHAETTYFLSIQSSEALLKGHCGITDWGDGDKNKKVNDSKDELQNMEILADVHNANPGQCSVCKSTAHT
jgi:hypothetical protein